MSAPAAEERPDAALRRRAQEIAASAPPLSPETVEKLRGLLRPPRVPERRA